MYIGGEIMARTKNTKTSRKSNRSECGRDCSKSSRKTSRTSDTRDCN